MLYQQALKQLNTIFTKVDIRPPNKKATVRSLVQERECQNLNSTDFKLLSSIDTASKPLQKLTKTIRVWRQVLENNEKARQQQQGKPVNRKILENLQFVMADCGQIDSKSQFVHYIKESGPEIYGKASAVASTKEYKEIYICNQIEFYNPITRIDQDEYLRELEELTEKLGILQQLSLTADSSLEDLQNFYQLLQSDELFKKKDNNLNRVINYNLTRAMQLMEDIDAAQKTAYYYQESLTFSIARCYYLCFQARPDITENSSNREHINMIKQFLCSRPEKVFPRLYDRKINKALLLIDDIQFRFLMSPYESEQKTVDIIGFFTERVKYFRSTFESMLKPLSESQFIELFTQIENTLSQLKVQSPAGRQLRDSLNQLEEQVVASFVNATNTGRRYLSEAVVRKSYASTVKFGRDSIVSVGADAGEDVFVKSNDTDEFTKTVQALVANKDKFENECHVYLDLFSKEQGDRLEDASKLSPEKGLALLEAAKALEKPSKQVQQIQALTRNMMKPQLSQENVERMFQPTLRVQVLKTFREKLIEHSYRLTKVINSSQFESFPQNVRQFALARESLAKGCERQLQNIIKISDIISRLKKKDVYDACDEMTYDTFLKVLLAYKETKAHQMSFKDEKRVSKTGKQFIQSKIYTPFLGYLSTILPQDYHEIVEDLEEVEFCVDLVLETNSFIDKYVTEMETEPESRDEIRNELGRILAKWKREVDEKLQMKKKYLGYTRAGQQVSKIDEVIAVCRGEGSTNITAPAARRILQMMAS